MVGCLSDAIIVITIAFISAPRCIRAILPEVTVRYPKGDSTYMHICANRAVRIKASEVVLRGTYAWLFEWGASGFRVIR